MPDKETMPYRPCVGIMVLNRAGLVWMGHRPLRERDEFSTTGEDRRWQMPQGGIDEGEDAHVAARRELWEETGIRSVEPLARTPGWLRYDLPDELIGTALKGRFRGQKQLWFAYRFTGTDEEINIAHPPDGAPVEFDRWQWVPIGEVAERIVPFKRAIYDEVVETFRPFAVPA